MGRRPGVTSAETRDALLVAAMHVFAEQGVAQAQLSAIASEAGVTPAAIYRHFDSKAELVQAAIADQLPSLMADALAGQVEGSLDELLVAIGSSLPTSNPKELSTVILELAALSNRFDYVRELVRVGFVEHETLIQALVDRAAADDVVDGALDPDAVARLLLMVILGSMVVSVIDLPPVDQSGWDRMIQRMVGALGPDDASPRLPR